MPHTQPSLTLPPPGSGSSRRGGPQVQPATRLSRRSGAVMVLVLLAVVLLASLVFYVLNLGQQTNQRVVTQHAADAADIAGAGYVARTFNGVAMNNTGIAQLLAGVNMLDSLPLATQVATKDQVALADMLRLYVGNGINGSWVEDAVRTMSQEVDLEVANLQPMDQFLNHSYDVAAMTHYDAPAGGRGQMWTAMAAMDQSSQVLMETLGTLAQVNAVRGGEAVSGYTGTALMLPVVPAIPWARGHFNDFERPVRQGLLPDPIDDKTVNRGPYDTIYGWRETFGGGCTSGYTIPGHSTGNSGGKGTIPIGSGSSAGGNGSRHVCTARKPDDKYRTWGPHGWMKRRVGDYSTAQLFHSRFGTYAGKLADQKLTYLWPGTAGGTLHQFLDNQWVKGYAASSAWAAAHPGEVKHTRFVKVEIKSKYPRSSSAFLTPGTWDYVTFAQRKGARSVWLNGWVDPNPWQNAPSVSKVGQMVLREEWSYTVTYDGSIGITPVNDPQTNAVIPQPVYRVDDFFFIGINVGKEVDVRDPYDGIDNRDDLPAPVDFDHAMVQTSPDARRQYLTYLAAARHHDTAMLSPTRFTGHKPYPNTVAISQAQVFNNHSWDLWTQMWHAQLEPVRDLDRWTILMGDQIPAVGTVPALLPDEYHDMQAYLVSLQPLAPVMLKH